ncbi:MAG TPA: amylo-alpha-1,6-glucosidase [Candidatus Acidoferrales bacterium]|nr:amylo-alpha-1,6-glucosidase [Candidatus Acidoferrales bacterium]
MPTADLAKLPTSIEIDGEDLKDLASADQREWLVTNGIGGFACGTLAGTLTRRYHGLLVAALHPPRQRTLLVSKIDEIVRVDSQEFELGANRWVSGAIEPSGYRYIESVRLQGAIPTWHYKCGSALLTKQIWMAHGENTTFVRYSLSGDSPALELDAKVLVNYRDFNSLTRAGGWRMQVERVDYGVKVIAYEGAIPFFLRSPGASADLSKSGDESCGEWYCGYELSEERARGFDHAEDHLHAATFHAKLSPGAAVTLVFSTENAGSPDGESAERAEVEREAKILATASLHRKAGPDNDSPGWLNQLLLAADAFLVTGEADSVQRGIIAGYPWFGVWSRDTLISLPGLLLVTGRAEIARDFLRHFAAAINGGMLPNFFPESGALPEFNSVDAPLWFVEAVREYVARTGDQDFALEMIPPISEIISSYIQGTRYGIHADPEDGLLFAGEPGTQLTWMDARVNGVPVTPRIGKPVEINALWLNAVSTISDLAEGLSRPIPSFRRLAGRIRTSFAKFWNPGRNFCFDVIDGPQGNDGALRPNQIFAASLRVTGLTAEQNRAVVDACEAQLLTPLGLRSLAPSEHGYCGRYEGNQDQRDAAYHQGTVWMWLLGPFISAHLRVYRDADTAWKILEAAASQLKIGALGNLNEIFDGDAPFTPRGCFAQAWSVGELLRAWDELSRLRQQP